MPGEITLLPESEDEELVAVPDDAQEAEEIPVESPPAPEPAKPAKDWRGHGGSYRKINGKRVPA